MPIHVAGLAICLVACSRPPPLEANLDADDSLGEGLDTSHHTEAIPVDRVLPRDVVAVDTLPAHDNFAPLAENSETRTAVLAYSNVRGVCIGQAPAAVPLAGSAPGSFFLMPYDAATGTMAGREVDADVCDGAYRAFTNGNRPDLGFRHNFAVLRECTSETSDGGVTDAVGTLWAARMDFPIRWRELGPAKGALLAMEWGGWFCVSTWSPRVTRCVASSLDGPLHALEFDFKLQGILEHDGPWTLGEVAENGYPQLAVIDSDGVPFTVKPTGLLGIDGAVFSKTHDAFVVGFVNFDTSFKVLLVHRDGSATNLDTKFAWPVSIDPFGSLALVRSHTVLDLWEPAGPSPRRITNHLLGEFILGPSSIAFRESGADWKQEISRKPERDRAPCFTRTRWVSPQIDGTIQELYSSCEYGTARYGLLGDSLFIHSVAPPTLPPGSVEPPLFLLSVVVNGRRRVVGTTTRRARALLPIGRAAYLLDADSHELFEIDVDPSRPPSLRGPIVSGMQELSGDLEGNARYACGPCAMLRAEGGTFTYFVCN